MKKIRTIQGCLEEIKKSDPDSAITLTAIRRAVSEGDVPSQRVGSGKQKKYLIDLDILLDYFGGGSNG